MQTNQRSDAEPGAPVDQFPVICVGASAGGLEAFRQLIGQLSDIHQQAYVLVQHLDPDHESLLPELLGKRSKLPVVSITDGVELEPGKIFLIPPGVALSVIKRKLVLSSFNEPRGLRRPIDAFLESLAVDLGSNCAAVILSGTGSDGSTGIKAIKEAGGLVFVQQPQQAKYDGMPKSAIASGAVDLVLPVEEIVGVIAEYFDRRSGLEPQIIGDADFLKRIAKHVRYRTGHDFEHYKQPTFMRRVLRRMSVLGATSPSDYLSRLITDPREAKQLCRDLLINVTSFFRDPECFDALRRQAIAPIVAQNQPNQAIRIWVPGCSTGQEAYSIAALVCEEVARTDSSATINVFATDIDEEALEFARLAIYPESVASEMPRSVLDRYFDVVQDGYRVCKELRDIVRVSRHNLISDPPFSRLDLVSCRNLLIYLDNTLQKRITGIFHYALRPHGFLFLGPSETPTEDGTIGFQALSRPERLYQRDGRPPRPIEAPLLTTMLNKDKYVHQSDNGMRDEGQSFKTALLARHTPPYVVVNQDREVVYSSHGISRFLGLPEGRARLNLFDLAKPELMTSLRGLLAVAPSEAETCAHRPFDGRIDGERVRLMMTVEFLPETDQFLIVFQDRFDPLQGEDGQQNESADAGITNGDDNTYVRDLEQRLDAAQQTIRTTVEELETSNEELKSSNEEMMSMNEELQSANEELSTINEELQNKNSELVEVNDDLENLIESTSIGIIFLDDSLKVRSFTPEAKNYFRLVDQDEGRPFDHVQTDLDHEQLLTASAEVLKTHRPEQFELQTKSGDHELLISIRPYRKRQGESSGIVMTFTPITEIKQAARDLENAKLVAQNRLVEIEQLYRVSHQAMGLIDRNLRITRANRQLSDIADISDDGIMGLRIDQAIPQLGEDVHEAVSQVFRTGETLIGKEISLASQDEGTQHSWEVDWYPVERDDEIYAVAVSVRDVTHHKQMQTELRRLMRELQHRVKNMLGNVTALINRARREDGEPDVILEKLVKRIRALASTHNLLTSENWRPTRFYDVLVPELTAIYGTDRVELRGPELRLNARATVSLGITIHELATNAAKYGALSNDTGTLSVRWSRVDEGDGDKFVVRWVERGGPATAPPQRVGFGSQLVRSTVEGSLRGTFSQIFEPDGLSCAIEIPAELAIGEEFDEDIISEPFEA